MRIGIRWKLLILLLVMALVPLIVVTRRVSQATYRLGREIGAQARKALIQRAEEQLLLFVNAQGTLLGSEATSIELAVALQAQRVERCLAVEDPPAAAVYYSDQYDGGTNVPDDLKTSPRYARLTADGQRIPIAVTLSQQVFKLAPGVTQDAVREDIYRLAPMNEAYAKLAQSCPGLLQWQYTTLENGVHSCCPGHGSYPADYDPRQREWYRRAKQRGGLCWTPPYVEVSTRQPVLTAAMPVRRPDGSFAGMTAVDVAVTDILARGRPPISASCASFVVAVVQRAGFDPHRVEPRRINWSTVDPAELGLFVFAQPAGQHDTEHWEAPLQQAWLESDDTNEFRATLQDMVANKSSVRRMSFRGPSCLWAYGPVWKEPGRGFLVVIVPYDEVTAEAARVEQRIHDQTRSQLIFTGVTSLVVCAIVVLVALFGSRAVTQPIRRLAQTAQHIAHGDLDARVEIRTRDELQDMGEAFNDMVPQLQDRVRMRQSLSLAMEVQQHLLPAGPPQIEGLDIAGQSIYCDETGGDYYDFLDLSELSPRELGIAVGDVTGHGVAAALLMTSARALLRTRAGRTGSISELMNEINRHLAADTPVGRFMTLFYMVLDASQNSVRWASAGHDPAIVYHPATDTFDELAGNDIPLGIEISWQYHESRRDWLAPGCVILIGTDGIWETSNPQRERFGKTRLREIIRRHAGDPAAKIKQAITDSLAAFRQNRPQQDDVTLVVVKTLP